MLYPDELRDRLLVVACLAAVLKPVAAMADHPCIARDPVTIDGQEVVASGVAWPDGKRPSFVGAAISPTERKADRYGRLHGFLLPPGGTEPLQIEWLRQGLGLADPIGVKTACAEALLAAEAEARAAKRGVWRHMRIERADDRSLSRRRADTFAIVEGRVVSVGDRARSIYLNFGTFWRQDFTVQIGKRDLKRHPELLARLVRAEGRTVRVRGRLTERDGPYMRVRDAGQIEFREEQP